LNVNEWGVIFAFSTAFNMSGFTSISIEFEKPSGATLTVSDPDVTVPGSDLPTTLGTFLANKYAKYIFQDGDVDEEGLWSCRVVYDDGSQHLISDVATFTVNP
jgi:hypothetical protein